MNKLENDFVSKISPDTTGRLSPDQTDRFERRLNNYRIHQIDCQMKNDQSFREMCEQESINIKKLQDQKTCEGRSRQKRVNKRQSKKNKNEQLGAHCVFPVNLEAPSQAPVTVAPPSDLADLNYREMFTLLGFPDNFPNSVAPFDHPRPNVNYNNSY